MMHKQMSRRVKQISAPKMHSTIIKKLMNWIHRRAKQHCEKIETKTELNVWKRWCSQLEKLELWNKFSLWARQSPLSLCTEFEPSTLTSFQRSFELYSDWKYDQSWCTIILGLAKSLLLPKRLVIESEDRRLKLLTVLSDTRPDRCPVAAILLRNFRTSSTYLCRFWDKAIFAIDSLYIMSSMTSNKCLAKMPHNFWINYCLVSWRLFLSTNQNTHHTRHAPRITPRVLSAFFLFRYVYKIHYRRNSWIINNLLDI